MNKRLRNAILIPSLSVLTLLLVLSGSVLFLFRAPAVETGGQDVHLYVRSGDSAEAVLARLEGICQVRYPRLLRMAARARSYDRRVRSGHYLIGQGESLMSVLSKLRRGEQTPIRLTIPGTRTLEQAAASISSQIMLDSLGVLTVLRDPSMLLAAGLDSAQGLSIVIPDTYEVYWNISPEALRGRLIREYGNFWSGRDDRAEAVGLTRQEVSILASIVEEETQQAAEMPVVAGLYMNRLRRHIPLQADPTVLFSLGLLGKAHRVMTRDLEAPSPYNTYRIQGLPPGPIRIPSPQGIDAVLNYQRHDYLYMCAREDFSGTHNFARTLLEHNRNADRYRAALNQRKIYK